MRRVVPSVLLLGMLGGAGAAAADVQEFGPEDIGRLAAMKKDSAARFQARVVDVGRFSGTGTVRHTSNENGTWVSMPGHGEVSCHAEAPGLAVGDRVQVTGVIGDAMTASDVATVNRIARVFGRSWTMPDVAWLSLLENGCAVRKAQ